MRVGKAKGRWRPSVIGSWTMPWQFRKRARDGYLPKYDNDPQWEPPEWFDLDDFDLPEDSAWRQIDTWAFGGLGLFERRTDPLPRPAFDFYDQRVGLEFENELYDMTATALPTLTALLGGVTWHTEFPYGWQAGRGEQGRTDVVVCEFDWEAYWRRREIVGPTSLSGQNWGYFRSYRWLMDRAITKQQFIAEGPYSESYLYDIWNWLERNGYLASNGRLGYSTAMPLPDHIEAAHAIELKQSNWEEALEQAERANGPDGADPDATDPRYRHSDPDDAGYADYRWVALDAGHLAAAWDNRDAFEDAGIGLIGIAEGGAVELVPAERCEHPEESLDRMKLIEDSVEELTPDELEEKQPEDDEDDDPDTTSAQMSIGGFT